MAFSKGDVVVRKRSGRTVQGDVSTAISIAVKGRVCRVVSPGLSYKVVYEGLNRCILQFDRSLALASKPGPDCLTHPSC